VHNPFLEEHSQKFKKYALQSWNPHQGKTWYEEQAPICTAYIVLLYSLRHSCLCTRIDKDTRFNACICTRNAILHFLTCYSSHLHTHAHPMPACRLEHTRMCMRLMQNTHSAHPMPACRLKHTRMCMRLMQNTHPAHTMPACRLKHTRVCMRLMQNTHSAHTHPARGQRGPPTGEAGGK